MVAALLLDKVKGYALTTLAVLLVLVGAYAMGGRAAKKSEQAKRNYDEALRSAAGAKGVHDAEVEVRRMPAGSAADQLQREWVRDLPDTDASAGSRGRDGS